MSMDKILIENLSLQYADGTEISAAGSVWGSRKIRLPSSLGRQVAANPSLLRCLNRLNDLTEVKAVSGRILIDGEDILDSERM